MVVEKLAGHPRQFLHDVNYRNFLRRDAILSVEKKM